MPLYPLGTIMEIIESLGAENCSTDLKVSYAYEDLVFLQHNAFLLQFTDNENEIRIHKNIEADASEIEPDIKALKRAGEKAKIRFTDGGCYSLDQSDEENIVLEFMPDSDCPQ